MKKNMMKISIVELAQKLNIERLEMSPFLVRECPLVDPEEVACDNLEIIEFDKRMTPAEVVAALDVQGYQPARIEQLLSYLKYRRREMKFFAAYMGLGTAIDPSSTGASYPIIERWVHGVGLTCDYRGEGSMGLPVGIKYLVFRK